MRIAAGHWSVRFVVSSPCKRRSRVAAGSIAGTDATRLGTVAGVSERIQIRTSAWLGSRTITG